MSKLVKTTVVHVVAWSIAAIGMGIIFCLPRTIADWGDDRIKTILLALLFIAGLIIDLFLRIYERSKKHGFIRDERDHYMQRKAGSAGFIITVLYIFILSISLYIKYENIGIMPIGWVWFIAYSTIAAANLSTGICSLIYYGKHGN